MGYTTCKNDVFGIVKDANKKFGDKAYMVDGWNTKLSKICEYIDELNKDFGYDQVDVSVDEHNMQIRVDIICFDLIMYKGRSSKFFDLISLLSNIRFTNVNGEMVRTSLYIDGVWGT